MSNKIEVAIPIEVENTKRKILMADDEEDIRWLFGKFLERYYDIVTAENGKDAWNKLNDAEEEFDLLIIDYQMPEFTGLEVLQRMRESNKEHLKNMPAIMMSGDFTLQVKRQVEELGAQTIEKPIPDLNTLVEMAKSALETSEAPVE